ncbi:hypothetical protein ES703_107861 [subsurface metagenome]
MREQRRKKETEDPSQLSLDFLDTWSRERFLYGKKEEDSGKIPKVDRCSEEISSFTRAYPNGERIGDESKEVWQPCQSQTRTMETAFA